MALSKIQFGNTGRRNLIINGAMKVQRGTTVSTLASSGYQVVQTVFAEVE